MSGPWIYVFVLQWLLLAVVAIVLIGALRQVGVLLLRVGPRPPLALDGSGPVLGALAHPVPTPVDGAPVDFLDRSFAGTVLAFVSPSCGSCAMVPDAARALQSDYPTVRFVLVVDGDDAATRDFAADRVTGAVTVTTAGSSLAAYQVDGTPYAVFVANDGTVRARGIANHREHLEELLRAGLGDHDDAHHHHADVTSPSTIPMGTR